MPISDFLSIDSEFETLETPTELNFLDSVKNKNITPMDCDEYKRDEDANDTDAEINKSFQNEMLKLFETIQHGIQF